MFPFFLVLLSIACIVMGVGVWLSKWSEQCPQCLKRVRANDHFCSHCGCNLLDPIGTDVLDSLCPACFSEVEATDNFCGYCGERLQPLLPPSQHASEQELLV